MPSFQRGLTFYFLLFCDHDRQIIVEIKRYSGHMTWYHTISHSKLQEMPFVVYWPWWTWWIDSCGLQQHNQSSISQEAWQKATESLPLRERSAQYRCSCLWEHNHIFYSLCSLHLPVSPLSLFPCLYLCHCSLVLYHCSHFQSYSPLLHSQVRTPQCIMNVRYAVLYGLHVYGTHLAPYQSLWH